MKSKMSYGEKNDINLKLVIALSRTHLDFNRNLQTFLNGFGLTVAQFGVLEALYHLGPMKVHEIIEKTLSTSGNMTVVIRNLERASFVERLVDSKDKRSFNIRLTADGAELIEEVFRKHLEMIDSFFSGLDSGERQVLQSLLKKLNGL